MVHGLSLKIASGGQSAVEESAWEGCSVAVIYMPFDFRSNFSLYPLNLIHCPSTSLHHLLCIWNDGLDDGWGCFPDTSWGDTTCMVPRWACFILFIPKHPVPYFRQSYFIRESLSIPLISVAGVAAHLSFMSFYIPIAMEESARFNLLAFLFRYCWSFSLLELVKICTHQYFNWSLLFWLIFFFFRLLPIGHCMYNSMGDPQ